ncbi:MAG: CHASE domain-containing protein, partial [Actinomycetota bacterium]|nr:CHASE domain-containing protein [Actinomycetota bacterium]
MGRLNAGLTALRPGLARFGHHLHRGAAAYGVLLIALLLTLLAFYYVRQNVRAEERKRFDETTVAVRTVIYRRVNRYVDAMFGARGLLFLGGDPVDRKEWDGYVKALKPAMPFRFNGLQFLGFAKYVRPRDRDAFSREAPKEGVRDPSHEPNGEPMAYFPLEFVTPSNKANRRMIGYSAYSDLVHRSAMDTARDTASPQATKMTYVLTEAPSNSKKDLALRKGLAIYLPVYKKGEPHGTVDERRHALRGFVVATFTADGLFGKAYASDFHPNIGFEVYDGEDAQPSSLLCDCNGEKNAGKKGSAPLFSRMLRVREHVIGREWTLYFTTRPRFEKEAKSFLPTFVLVSGVTISFLLFGITWMLVRSRSQAVRVSADLKEANRELEQANSELQSSREGLVSAREEERRRLRRDLHDGVGPQLAALMLELETAGELVSDNPEASALIAKLSKRAREIVRDVRHSVHALRPPALDELGLVGALREGAIQYGPAGLRVSVESTGELSRLPAAVEVACYRIAQEAITNVSRHAKANSCRISLELDEAWDVLVVEVADDGVGMPEGRRAGVG